LIVSLTTEEIRQMFLYLSKQIIANQSLLIELDKKIGGKSYGGEIIKGFNAIIHTLSEQRSFHINDIFTDSGIAMLSSTKGFSGIIFGTLFLGGVSGMPNIDELHVKQLSAIFDKALQTLKAWGADHIDGKIIIHTFESSVVAFHHSVKEGDDLIQALQVGEISAKEAMEHLKHYQTGFDPGMYIREKVVSYYDPGAVTVWLIVKPMLEWVESLENARSTVNT
jgi:hypothetical protein